MQIVTQEVKDYLDQLGRVELTIYSEGSPLDLDIVRATYSAAAGGADAFSIGAAASAELVLNLAQPAQLPGGVISAGWSAAGAEYPLIYGKVDSVQESGGGASVTVRDAMYWAASTGYTPAEACLTECAASVVLTDVAQKMAVTPAPAFLAALAGITLPEGVASMSADTTLAQAAGTLAGLLGGCAVINRAGELAYVVPVSSGYTLEPYADGETGEAVAYTPTGVAYHKTITVRVETETGTEEITSTEDYLAGADGARVDVNNVLADQATADRAWAVLAGKSWCAGSWRVPGGLLLEPGDLLQVATLKGTFPVLVSQLVLHYDGGVMVDIVSAGAGQYTAGHSGSLGRMYKELDQKVYRVQTSVNGLISEAADVRGRLTRVVQETERVVIEALRADDINGVRSLLSAQLQILADTIAVEIGRQEQAIGAVAGDVENIRRRFAFGADGLAIGEAGGNVQLLINERGTQQREGDEIVLEQGAFGTVTSKVNTQRIDIGDYTIYIEPTTRYLCII